MDDARLLAHYLAVAREPWNRSAEAAYLEYATRAWLAAAWPAGAVRAINIGIGAGGWDDVLADRAAELTSVDVDPEICALHAYRLRRLGVAARVVCGDLLDDALPTAGWDVVTAIGSTIGEIGDRERAIASLARLCAPGGRLLVHGDRETIDPAWARGALHDFGSVDARVDPAAGTFVTAIRAARRSAPSHRR